MGVFSGVGCVYFRFVANIDNQQINPNSSLIFFFKSPPSLMRVVIFATFSSVSVGISRPKQILSSTLARL